MYTHRGEDGQLFLCDGFGGRCHPVTEEQATMANALSLARFLAPVALLIGGAFALRGFIRWLAK